MLFVPPRLARPKTVPSWVATSNLLTDPTVFASGWTATNCSVADNTGRGWPGLSDVVTEASDTSVIHSLARSYSFTSGLTYLVRLIVKRGSGTRNVALVLGTAAFPVTEIAAYDLDGAGTAVVKAGTGTATIQRLDEDNYVVGLQQTSDASTSSDITIRMWNNSAASGSATYNGDGTSSLIISAVGLHTV